MGGPLTIEELRIITRHRKPFKYFVETGTYHGDTTILVSDHYDHVYTTEIIPELYEESKKRAENLEKKNITFLLGDSVKLLHEITPKVKDGAIFFLDAHQSGNDTGNNGKSVPLLEELEVILSYNVKPSVFIIDDLRLWKGKAWDWSHITNENIINLFRKHNYNLSSYYEDNDRFIIITK